MGNTVSAAEVVAANITHPTNKQSLVPPQNHDTSGVPPPECPMHQKEAPKPAASECPIGYTNDNSDINPYNMVSFIKRAFLIRQFIDVRFILNVDATRQSESSPRSTVSVAKGSSAVEHTKSHRRRYQGVLVISKSTNVLERNATQGLAMEERRSESTRHG